MAKSFPSATKLRELTRIVASERVHRPKQVKPSLTNKVSPKENAQPGAVHSRTHTETLMKKMSESEAQQNRLPLSVVVSDCVKRWFQDTLKDAKEGDPAMQVLVGQMYCSGYGVPRDLQKGRAWLSRASRSKSSVWKVGGKNPGYNASDSDSDEEESKLQKVRKHTNFSSKKISKADMGDLK